MAACVLCLPNGIKRTQRWYAVNSSISILRSCSSAEDPETILRCIVSEVPTWLRIGAGIITNHQDYHAYIRDLNESVDSVMYLLANSVYSSGSDRSMCIAIQDAAKLQLDLVLKTPVVIAQTTFCLGPNTELSTHFS